MYIRILYSFCLLGLLSPLISCEKEVLLPLDRKIIWVNSSLRECPSPSIEYHCLYISETKELDEAIWDIQVRQINGFEHNEGFIYQLSVQETYPSTTNSQPYEAKNYRLIKVLSQEIDEANKFSGMWNLEYLDGYAGDENLAYGKRFIIDPFYRTLYGTYKCNPYHIRQKY